MKSSVSFGGGKRYDQDGLNGPFGSGSALNHQLIDTLAHLNRERIPERLVHAKGAGAYGEFEVTHDISDICSINMLDTVGKKTSCVVRFSTSTGERGSADTVRDPRGMAIKFFTEEGNWDWTYNSVPFFFLRDPAKFPALIHSQKRDWTTNLRDPDRFWDYVVKNQECIHMITYLFSDYGTPRSFRHINGYMAHTHRFVKQNGEWRYIHILLETTEGLQNLTGEEAERLAGTQPDFASKDLYDAIEKGNYPTWDVSVQVIDAVEAERYRFNIFDLTKAWPTTDIPRRPFGRLTLNRNPVDYFTEIEQLAFSPSNLVPGIIPSADPVLQARLFAYPDAHRHRLGVNNQFLPCNHSSYACHPSRREGAGLAQANNGANDAELDAVQTMRRHSKVKSQQELDHARWAWRTATANLTDEVSDVDFRQASHWWKYIQDMDEFGHHHFVRNVSRNLCHASLRIRRDAYAMFARVDEKCGTWIERETEAFVAG